MASLFNLTMLDVLNKMNGWNSKEYYLSTLDQDSEVRIQWQSTGRNAFAFLSSIKLATFGDSDEVGNTGKVIGLPFC